ncbi:hypothetical protein MMC18_004605 [Xylographa bjoerkii]|nr:hypothetical protein [Xylographa bjoerkii]
MGDIVFAQLQAIDLSRLSCREPSEMSKLLVACETDGFFYLDLRGISSSPLLEDWKKVLSLVDRWFDRPLEHKMQYHHGTVLHGYTPVGSYAGVLEGTKDGNETIKITSEALAKPLLLPDVVSENLELFKRFNAACHSITIELLICLSDALGLQGEERYENSHRKGLPANRCLNFFRYPKKSMDEGKFGQNKHTDNGTLTLLLTEQLGLQVFSVKTQAWENVAPIPGHAVINVADTLRFLSGRRLRSAVHRVIPVFEPSQQNRFSIGYFLRAEDDKVLESSDGALMTAREWHDQKYVNYKASHDVQRTNSVLLGGMKLGMTAA